MPEKKQVVKKDVLGNPISRDEAYAIIASSKIALELFQELSQEQQEQILGFVQGNTGLPILYDGFYKYVFDPETHPERLEDFLSNLLGQEVKIQEVLTRDGVRLSDAGTMVVMDIVVQLSDGRVVDVEMQKYGCYFTGERSSCYMADMIMRQYNRIRAREKTKYVFGKMEPVYLIVLLENSTKEFRKAEPAYIHKMQSTLDTGAEVKLLANLIYVSLDTFYKVSKTINNKLEAWLTFLSSDKPEDIMRLVEQYPEFEECYHDIAIFRRKPEELMGYFSEALREMDRNTMQYTIEQMLKEKIEEVKEKEAEILEAKMVLDEAQTTLDKKRHELESTQNELESTQNELESAQTIIRALMEENRKLKEEKC